MAEERETEKEKGAEEAAPPKGSKMKLVLIGVAVVVVLAGAGGGAYFFLAGGKGDAEAKAGAAALADVSAINLELKPFLVNLADPGGKHYIKTTLTLEMQDEASAGWVKAHLPRVRDRILMLLSARESAELLSAEGKFRLRDDILAAVNGLMPGGRTEAVYLTEFVVQ